MRRIVSFKVRDIALVPWSATEIGTGRTKEGNRKFRFPTKNKRLTIFQEQVHRHALAAMTLAGIPPQSGPIDLFVGFIKKTADVAKHGTWCILLDGEPKNTRGDLTNYMKAVEDALEDAVYPNDNQVASSAGRIVWGDADEIHVVVSAHEDPPRLAVY